MPTRLLCLTVLLTWILCDGCADVASLAHTLNERGDTACIWASGSYGPFLGLRIVAATGGATLKECMRGE